MAFSHKEYGLYLESVIRQEMEAWDHSLGWRFLYSPTHVLDSARVAFIGLNPGGSFYPKDHPKFARSFGSAFVDESWSGKPQGSHPLQLQVRELFRRMNEKPENVLAGNLVLLRSSDWKRLRHRVDAIRFGVSLWKDIIERVRPEVLIAMGNDVHSSLREILSARVECRVPVSWGNISAKRGTYKYGKLFVLPHLSRFKIMTRVKSAEALNELFDGKPKLSTQVVSF